MTPFEKLQWAAFIVLVLGEGPKALKHTWKAIELALMVAILPFALVFALFERVRHPERARNKKMLRDLQQYLNTMKKTP